MGTQLYEDLDDVESIGGYDGDDESFAESDDDLDEAQEFIPGIPNPIAGVGGALGSLFNRQRRSPLPRVQVGSGRGGLASATIATPRGNARISFPEPVVRQDEFKAATARLQEAINRNTARLNTLEKDQQQLSQRIGTVVTETRRDVAKALKKARLEHAAALAKLRKEQAGAWARERQRQASRDQMNMMLTLFTQQAIQKQLDDHTHAVTAGATRTGPASTDDDNNSALLLPLLMMSMQDGGGGGGDDPAGAASYGGGGNNSNNNMMWLMMLPILMDR